MHIFANLEDLVNGQPPGADRDRCSGGKFQRSPEAVPCASILSMLERAVGSKRYNEGFQKIFFDTIYRRLLSLTSRSDVLYARGIVRILTQLHFFMEDSYFEKLRVLLDYISAKEKFYQINDSFLEAYVKKLRNDRNGCLCRP